MRMTTDDIKLIAFILLALIVGSTAKYYRSRHVHRPGDPPPSQAGEALH